MVESMALMDETWPPNNSLTNSQATTVELTTPAPAKLDLRATAPRPAAPGVGGAE